MGNTIEVFFYNYPDLTAWLNREKNNGIEFVSVEEQPERKLLKLTYKTVAS